MSRNCRNFWKSWELRLICSSCQLFAGGMVSCTPAYCLFLTYVSPECSPLNLRCAIGLACYFSLNLFVGWIQFKQKLGFADSVAKAAVGRVDCGRCSASVLVGSYHCPVCDTCVWRRDHHCFFLGGCVGFSNLKSFVSFCLNACLGCAYALLLLRSYLSLEFHPLWSRHFMYYFVPYTFARWLIGDVASRHFVATIALNAVAAVFITTLCMFSFQVYLIFVSKTSYEFFCKGSSSVVSPPRSWRNFERTLGSNWFLHLIFPVLSLNLRGSLASPKKDSLNEAMKYV